MKAETVRRVAPVAAAVAVLAVLAGTAYVVRDAGGDAQGPAPLHLTSSRAAAARDAAVSGAVGGRFELAGDLPGGVPADTPVQVFGSGPSEATLSRLADALGLRGALREKDGARVLVDGDAGLVVAATRGSPWQFNRTGGATCLPVTGSDDGVVSSCATADAPTTKAALAAPRPAEAVALAAPVLTAAGVDPARARAVPAPPVTVVTVDPEVAGLETAGAATTVTVDPAGVVTAQGWLARTTAGDPYPLISAQAAFDRLAELPVPLLACPEPAPPTAAGGPSCGGPVTITGARLGLSLQWEGDRPLLVPSWLFRVAGSDEPVVMVAVDPAYLQEPTAVPTPGDGGTGSGGRPSSVPGSSGSAEPGSTGAGGGAVPPAVQPETSSRFETARLGSGDSLVVTFVGGPDQCFGYEVLAKESTDRVLLFLQEQARSEMCEAIAQTHTRTVRLEAPLGDRKVFDAASGEPLLVAR